LLCMRLWYACKSRLSLEQMVLSVLRLVFKPKHCLALEAKIKSGNLRLPSYDLLRRASLKLDLFDMLWQQHVISISHVVSINYLDASPQGGYNYLVSKCDELVFPKKFQTIQLGHGFINNFFFWHELPHDGSHT
jgi:hypothetical protein